MTTTAVVELGPSYNIRVAKICIVVLMKVQIGAIITAHIINIDWVREKV